MRRDRAGVAARVACFLVAIGLLFGFISVVAATARASGFRLRDGVEPGDYVTLGRRAADSGSFRHRWRILFLYDCSGVGTASRDDAQAWYTSLLQRFQREGEVGIGRSQVRFLTGAPLDVAAIRC